jgi:hypothetical protein
MPVVDNQKNDELCAHYAVIIISGKRVCFNQLKCRDQFWLFKPTGKLVGVILKHVLRDKPQKDLDEKTLFQNLSETVSQFKGTNNIPEQEYRNNKTDINHAPIKGGRKMLK